MADVTAPYVDLSSALPGAKPVTPPSGASPEQIDRAAQDFEAVFLSQMLETMFAGISTDGPFGGGHAEGVFRSLMIQEYGKTLAKHGGIGLSDAIKRDMLQLQEVAKK